MVPDSRILRHCGSFGDAVEDLLDRAHVGSLDRRRDGLSADAESVRRDCGNLRLRDEVVQLLVVDVDFGEDDIFVRFRHLVEDRGRLPARATPSRRKIGHDLSLIHI